MTMVIDGVDDVKDLLLKKVPKQANNILRATIHGVAGEVAKEAKKRVPVLTKNLKRSIKTKRRKGKPGKPISDVIVTRGKKEKNDGFYWRFVEFGTQGKNPQSAQPFMVPAFEKVSANLDKILEEQFIKKLKAAVKREQKKRAKK